MDSKYNYKYPIKNCYTQNKKNTAHLNYPHVII